MSEFNQPADLGPFEARLAELLPRSTEVDRDEVLFEAGRQSANRAHRRAMRKWHGLSGLLVCLVVGQWMWLPSTQPTGQTTPVANQATETPPIPESPTDLEQPASSQNRPALAEAKRPQQVADEPSIPSTNQPSLWGHYFGTENASLAMQRQLSVGSSRKGTLPMPTLPPRAGSLPSQLDSSLKTMHRDWSLDNLANDHP